MATNAYLEEPQQAEEHGDKGCCNLFRCFCCWHIYCRPHIPRFAPGRDHISINISLPSDDAPAWSVLVGCISAMVPFHNLRLHRFRVTNSGRVIGRSDDMLEPFLTVSPNDDEKHNTYISHATAALAPDGRRLYGFCTHSAAVDGAMPHIPVPAAAANTAPLQFPHRAFAVNLDDTNKSRLQSSPLPPLPFLHGSYMTVSAEGKLWAPSVEDDDDEDVNGHCPLRLVMRRLDGESVWEEAASVDDIPYRPLVNSHLSGDHIQGYAVIDDRFILLSLIDSTFFCFDCSATTFTPVTTTVGEPSKCIPICRKGTHLDGMVYFLRCSKLFAYKFSPHEGKLAPTIGVDLLWPYYEEGYGAVVHLTGRMLCAVWMNMNVPCGCAERHALITTFLLKGEGDSDDDDDSFVPSGVEVLHSTCRRVDMLRSRAVPQYESCDFLCFLQEYPDSASVQVDVDPSLMSIGPSSPTKAGYVEEEITDDMPSCCRAFLTQGRPILKECTSVVTKPNFYFICQAHDQSHVYQISVARGKLACHDQLLQPHLSLDTITPGECAVEDPPAWHFVQQGPNKLYVIPSAPAQNHYKVDVSTKLCSVIKMERPHDGVRFSVVSRAGQHIVALGDTLQDVYVLNEPALKWLPVLVTTSSFSKCCLDLTQKVNVSGFVDLIHDDILVVSDADVAGLFILDLGKKEWYVVKPPSGIWLCGRCLFAEGFIYACTGIGFVAFELLKEDGCYGLGWPIFVEFPHVGFPDRKLVSFDLICKELNPSSLVLCVVQGCFVNEPFISHHKLFVTTVEVKLQEMPKGRKVPIRIDHIDISSDSRVDHEGWIWTSHAFSL